MLIKNKVARTTRPAITQISIAIPNIVPPERSVLSSRFPACLTARHHIQVVHDPLRIAVPQEHLAIRSLDVDDLVAPDIRPCTADAANAVATSQAPWLDRITHDRLLWNRAQAEAEHTYLNTVPQETILKAAPRHCDGSK